MDGIIIVNKELGYTSNDVVQIAKKIFNEKVGHTGTLDPMATGVLPLLIGKGTKLSKYLINHDKFYRAKIKLGYKTDTGDREGKIIEEKEVLPTILDREYVVSVLNCFVGKQQQTPPIYSAIKVNGKKLYEYARQGEKVEIKPREINIYNIKLIDIIKDEVEFEVSCSKGTYIRTLCEDIADRLGTVGFMSSLHRIQVGDFNINDAVYIKDLKNNFNNVCDKYFISFEKFFENKDKINLEEKVFNKFVNGVKIYYEIDDGVFPVYFNNTFVGTGLVENRILKRDILMSM